MPHSLIVDFDSPNNSSKPNTIINSTSNLCNVVQSKAEHAPLNEFSENDDILSGAFPDLFPLGYSCNKKGPLAKQQIKHLLYQFTGNFAACPCLHFYLLNQMQRHRNILGIHSKLKLDKKHLLNS